MFKSLTLALLATLAFATDAPKEVKSPATILYEKAIADNAKDAERAYEAYQKALDAANKKVVAALEAAKKDLNNASKGKLTISERADAIKEIDEKIAKVKEGSVGNFLVNKANKVGDLLGDELPEPILGKWATSHNYTFVFKPKGVAECLDKNGSTSAGTYEKVGEEYVVKWIVGSVNRITLTDNKNALCDKGIVTLKRIEK